MTLILKIQKNPSHILYQLLHSLHYLHLPSHIFHISTLKATTTTTISLLQYFYPPNLIKIISFHHQILPLHISLQSFLIDTAQRLWLEVLIILETKTVETQVVEQQWTSLIEHPSTLGQEEGCLLGNQR
ncbi:unnamed protein product [Meloidogyne enterolobii]|uniref:Uncharacterized protein n=1 Tax=Meloidogyne enterolobii TaxID=390850 RepID=A0ACB0XTV8_MELEN